MTENNDRKQRQKPSERFIKHGWLEHSEEYHPDIHNAWATTMEERNHNNATTPTTTYYSTEEMDKMRKD